MNLLADESVDSPIVERLRAAGHDVTYVAELSPSIADDDVLKLANDRRLALVTADKDFGDLVFRLGRAHAGVVLVRLEGLSADAKARIVEEVFRNHEAELIAAFTVVSPGGIRIHHLP